MLYILGLAFVLTAIHFSFKIWRVKQFQKVSGLNFIKAWFVLGK